MAMRPFFNVKVFINDVAYSAAEVNIDDSVTDIETSNTEGTSVDPAATENPAFETHMGGPQMARVTVKNASFSDTENPFAAPFNVTPRSYIAFQMQTNGALSPDWTFPSLFIQQVSHGGQIKGAQPVSFTGISNGEYTDPSA